MRGKAGKEIDMLNGPLLGKIIRFAIPIALSVFLQQLFNAADIAVVGQFAADSRTALAAVGGNSFVIGLMVNLFSGMSVGANVVIASYRGQRRDDETNRAVHTAVAFSLVCGVALMIAGLLLADVIHGWMGTGEEGSVLRGQAALYFRIYFLGVPFIMLYNYESAILRSKGDTRRPLFVLACSGVLNVALNVILVRFFHLEVAGVAIATLASNVFSSAVLFVLLLREQDAFRLIPRRIRMERKMLARMVRIGLPAGIQTSMFSIANVILQSQINALGPTVIASSTVGVYAEFFAYDFIAGFSQAVTTFVGQNYAAGNIRRCRTITRLCFFCGTLGTLTVSVALTLLRFPFVSLFTSDELVIPVAAERVLRVGTFQWVNGMGEFLSGSLRGMKRSSVPAVISVLGICGVRLIWVFFFYPAHPGYENLLVAWPLSWAVMFACMLAAFFIVRPRAEAEVRKQKGSAA